MIQKKTFSRDTFAGTKEEFDILVESAKRKMYSTDKMELIQFSDVEDGTIHEEFELRLKNQPEEIPQPESYMELMFKDNTIIVEYADEGSLMNWGQYEQVIFSDLSRRLAARGNHTVIAPDSKHVYFRIKLLNRSYLAYKIPIDGDKPGKFKTFVLAETEFTKNDKYNELKLTDHYIVSGFTSPDGKDGSIVAVVDNLKTSKVCDTPEDSVKMWDLIMSRKICPLIMFGPDEHQNFNMSLMFIEDVILCNERNPKFTKSNLVIL